MPWGWFVLIIIIIIIMSSSLFSLAPYAQFTAADSVIIHWRTSTPATGLVRYTQAEPTPPLDQWQTAVATADGLIVANVTEHAVPIGGLDPTKPLTFVAESAPLTTFTAYEITRGPTETSAPITLRPWLAAPDTLRLAIFNDLHSHKDYIARGLALPETQDLAPGLVLFNGDCAGDASTLAELDTFFLSALPPTTAAGHTLLFLRGNHDYRGAMARHLREHLSPLKEHNGYYGAFTLGPVRFLCLDTGEDKPDDHPKYGALAACDALFAEQVRFAKAEMQSEEWKSAPWRVVVLHMSPFCDWPEDDNCHAATRLRNALDEAFAGANIDLMLAAHTHHYNLFPANTIGRPYPILIGGGCRNSDIATITHLSATPTRLSVTPYKIKGAPLPGVYLTR